LVFLGLPAAASAQTYSSAEINKLIAIKTANDQNNTLSWLASPPPDTSAGVTWQNFSSIFQVTELSIYGKQLSGSLDLSGLDKLITLVAYSNQLTGLDVSQNTALQYLDVEGTWITSLNVDNNPDLQYLSASNTGITSLNVSSNSNLYELVVNGSKFPLSQLYPMTLSTADHIALGIQTDVTLPAISIDPIPGQGYDLASEAFLGGRNTVFSLTIDGSAAVSGSDYSINGAGVLTFLERGEYRITMQNDAVRSRGYYGTDMAAVITAPISVLPAGSRIFWDGSSSPVWVPVSSGAA
jgi:hypothetical protein